MDYLSLVATKELEWRGLFDRMDADRKLYELEPFVFKDQYGIPLPNVESVTANDPQTFADKVIFTLSDAKTQITVEGEEMSDTKTAYIESFLKDVLLAIDDNLSNRYIAFPGIRAFTVGQLCLRGYAARRCCVYVKDGEVVFDVVPLDTRFLTYEVGGDSLSWGAYKTTRPKASILSEYKKEIRSNEAEVVDFWDEEFERVFIEGIQVKEQRNPYGYVPFVIQACQGGGMFFDPNIQEHIGESIYSANRGLFPRLNEFISTLATLSKMSFLGGLQYESEAGEDAEAPEVPPYGQRFVAPIDKGGGYKGMPVNDMTQAMRLYYAILDARIQRGSLPAIDFGNLTFPLSAVAIARLTATRDNVFIPRLQAESLLDRKNGLMLIKQFRDLGLAAKVGVGGHRSEYVPAKMEGDFSISYQYTSVSSEQNIANYSMAAAAEAFVDRDTIRRTILQLDNPDDVESKRTEEMANRVVPTLALYRMAKAKLEQGLEIEAQIIAEQLGLTLKQIRSGNISGPEKKLGESVRSEEKPTQPLVPLMGGGIKAPSSGKEADQLAAAQETE